MYVIIMIIYVCCLPQWCRHIHIHIYIHIHVHIHIHIHIHIYTHVYIYIYIYVYTYIHTYIYIYIYIYTQSWKGSAETGLRSRVFILHAGPLRLSLRHHWFFGERGLRVVAYACGAGFYSANTGISLLSLRQQPHAAPTPFQMGGVEYGKFVRGQGAKRKGAWVLAGGPRQGTSILAASGKKGLDRQLRTSLQTVGRRVGGATRSNLDLS